jgi:hypothetical protein
MMFVPEIEPRSFFFFYFEGATGRSYSVRTYTGPSGPPAHKKQTDFPSLTAEQIMGMAVHRVLASPHLVTDSAHWWQITQELNARHLGGKGGAATAEQAAMPPPTTAPPTTVDLFFSRSGQPLRSLEDWRVVHPEAHWRARYSAMEVARCWSVAAGWPTSFREALGGVWPELVLERAIAEHQTAVPGKGNASHTDLMVFARSASRAPVIVGVEAKVDESFGPLVGDWLGQADTEAHRANREERLTGLCAALELRPSEVRGVRYQLLHRAYAALETARGAGAADAVLAIHSLRGRAAAGGNWDDFRTFARLLGRGAIGAGQPVHVGRRHGVELWLLWVTEPLQKEST